MPTGDVFDDLAAEQDALAAVLAALKRDAWCHASGAAGWTVADVVLHLTQIKEYMIGEQAAPVRCELLAPHGQMWQFGPADAPSVITGPAGTFCRVGARRLPPNNRADRRRTARRGGAAGHAHLRHLTCCAVSQCA